MEVLRDLPVCTGVGVRRDVVGIDEFYSILSGENVELNGFIDLSAMAAAAGYKFRARNMTSMGVQVLGTVLNKPVSDQGLISGTRNSLQNPENRAEEQYHGPWSGS